MSGPSMRLALVIGAMKCGTTSFFQYLGRHPDVRPSRTKQLNFFSNDARWSRGTDWYRGQWPTGDGSDPVLLEASPSYTYPETAKVCADRIASIEGYVRLIYLVRDPIERIESHYFHGYHRGEFEDSSSVDAALDRYPRLLDVTRYGRWIDLYRTRVGADRLLVLRTADLERRPAEALQQVCRFLGINDSFEFPDLTTRYNRQELQPADHPMVERLRGVGWLTGAVRGAVPLRIRERMKLLLKSAGDADSASDGRFRLSEGARARVREELAGDVAIAVGVGAGEGRP